MQNINLGLKYYSQPSNPFFNEKINKNQNIFFNIRICSTMLVMLDWKNYITKLKKDNKYFQLFINFVIFFNLYVFKINIKIKYLNK